MNLPLLLMLLVFSGGCGLFNNDRPGFFTVTPVSAVEAALEINALPGAEITIARNGQEIYSFRMTRSDTVVYDGGLQPATSYIWKAAAATGRGQTMELQATTLDTTSGNFTWQTFSFGEHSFSVLYGVSIIDENNIWAVGEIYMNDSTGQSDGNIYNVIHWDGEKWELLNRQYNCRLHFPNCGPVTNLDIKSSSVMGFNSSDIWITAGSAQNFDGESWTQHAGIQGVGNSNKIWGSDSNNAWFVGNNGLIAHKKDDSWQKIETGTELDFYDIHGNEKQGVVAIAAQQSKSSDKAILRIKDDLQTESLSTDPIPFSISGIWFDLSGVTYVAGSRISLKSNIDSSVPWRILDKERIGHPYLFAIDANGLNDIVAAGGFGEMVHFNGAAWTLYEQGITGNLYDVAIKEHTVAAVGYDGRRAFITIGKRVNQ